MPDLSEYPYRTAEPGTVTETPAAVAPAPEPTTPGAIARVLFPAEDGTKDAEWADLRDPNTLRARDRKNVLRKIKGDGAGGFAVDLTDGIMALLIVAWSLPLPIPAVRLDSLGDLTMQQENAMQAHPLVEQTVRMVKGDDSPQTATPETVKDPGSPSAPSAG